MTNGLDALLTALYVKIDDEMTDTRWLGRPPRLSDSELVCLAVAQAILGFTSESRWLRFVSSRLGEMFPFAPKQPGWNKRLRAALPLVKRTIRLLATDTDFWFDNHWIIDSTPVECGRSRPTAKRSDLANPKLDEREVLTGEGRSSSAPRGQPITRSLTAHDR